MSLNVNLHIVGGRITRDPVLRNNKKNPNVETVYMTVAADRGYSTQDGKTPADFIGVAVHGFQPRNSQQPANNKIPEMINNSLRKGSQFFCMGPEHTWTTQDQNGNYVDHSILDVSQWSFVDPKSMSANGGVSTGNNPQPTTPPNPFAPQGNQNNGGGNANANTGNNTPAPNNNGAGQANNAPANNANNGAANNGGQQNTGNNTPQNTAPQNSGNQNNGGNANGGNANANGGSTPKAPKGNGNKKIDISDDDLPF